jgi:hypothetical protein
MCKYTLLLRVILVSMSILIIIVVLYPSRVIIIRERGLIFRYLKQYELKNSVSCIVGAEASQTFDPVSFSDIFTAFLVIFFGIALSLIFSCIEFISSKRIYQTTSHVGHLMIK